MTKVALGSRAILRAAIRVKPEQASKVLMRMPTRHRDGAGRTGWEVIDRCTGSIRRGNGRGASEERDGLSGETRFGRDGGSQRHLRDGGLERESDRGVVCAGQRVSQGG